MTTIIKPMTIHTFWSLDRLHFYSEFPWVDFIIVELSRLFIKTLTDGFKEFYALNNFMIVKIGPYVCYYFDTTNKLQKFGNIIIKHPVGQLKIFLIS